MTYPRSFKSADNSITGTYTYDPATQTITLNSIAGNTSGNEGQIDAIKRALMAQHIGNDTA